MGLQPIVWACLAVWEIVCAITMLFEAFAYWIYRLARPFLVPPAGKARD